MIRTRAFEIEDPLGYIARMLGQPPEQTASLQVTTTGTWKAHRRECRNLRRIARKGYTIKLMIDHILPE